MVGLELDNVAVDGVHHQGTLRRPARRPQPSGPRQAGLKRSVATEAKGIPLAAVPAPADRHDSPLLAPTLDKALAALSKLGPADRAARIAQRSEPRS
jgi:Transposase DDE domain